MYADNWIEDDGISVDPGTYNLQVTYTGQGDAVEVSVTANKKGFEPLWNRELHVILPVGDLRTVPGARKTKWEERDAWLVKVD
jgi:hypothetical protein